MNSYLLDRDTGFLVTFHLRLHAFSHVSFRTMHSLHVLAQGAWIGVALRTSGDFASIRFLDTSGFEEKHVSPTSDSSKRHSACLSNTAAYRALQTLGDCQQAK